MRKGSKRTWWWVRRPGCLGGWCRIEATSDGTQTRYDVVEQLLHVRVRDHRIRRCGWCADNEDVRRGCWPIRNGDDWLVSGEVELHHWFDRVRSTQVVIPIVDLDDCDAVTDVAEESSRILRVDAFHTCIKDAPWRPDSRVGLSRVPKGLVIGTQFGDNGSTAKAEQLPVLTRRIRRIGPAHALRPERITRVDSNLYRAGSVPNERWCTRARQPRASID
mgnify:CR=1 FL=1